MTIVPIVKVYTYAISSESMALSFYASGSVYSTDGVEYPISLVRSYGQIGIIIVQSLKKLLRIGEVKEIFFLYFLNKISSFLNNWLK